MEEWSGHLLGIMDAVRGQVGAGEQGVGKYQEFNFDFAEFELYLDT